MAVEIEAKDVIRLMLQFCHENNLSRTLETLEDETGITLNTVESVETFQSHILQGHWDTVLKTLDRLHFTAPQAPTAVKKKVADVYEQVILELLELRETSAARSLLRQTEPMQFLKEKHQERYLQLELLLSRSTFNEKEAYPDDTSKESRRRAIADALASEVQVVPSSRLLTLLGQAIKWQHQQGTLPPDTPFDLFKGTISMDYTANGSEDVCPSILYTSIKFPKKQHAECGAFSPDGHYYATGTVDGFIELWNYMNGKLCRELAYQAQDKPMVMESAVLCLCFSRDSQLLASGSQSGAITVWKVATGTAIKQFPHAHGQGVTSLTFSRDGSQLLSGSFDFTVRLHGLKSGKTLKEYRGHSSFVNDAIYSIDGTRMISGSSDGSLRIWDAKTTTCLYTLYLKDGHAVPAGVTSCTVAKLACHPRYSDRVIVCTKSAFVYVLSLKGSVILALKAQEPPPPKGAIQQTEAPPVVIPDFVTMALSPKGEYIYAVDEKNKLSCFWAEENKTPLHSTLQLRDTSEFIGIQSHPIQNIISCSFDDGTVGFWKATL